MQYILEPIVKDTTDAQKTAEGVYEWLKSVDVPNKLKDEGFSDADVEKLTELAFTTPSLDIAKVKAQIVQDISYTVFNKPDNSAILYVVSPRSCNIFLNLSFTSISLSPSLVILY